MIGKKQFMEWAKALYRERGWTFNAEARGEAEAQFERYQRGVAPRLGELRPTDDLATQKWTGEAWEAV